MKIFILCVIFQIASSFEASAETFEQFQLAAVKHRADLDVEGLSYIVGGAVGLTSSLALGITSTEILPKIGYSLIETLSSAAIAYGGILYFNGDDITQEAQKLRDFEVSLSHVMTLSPVQRKKILDESTETGALRAYYRKKRARQIRAVLELTTAASAGSTMAFSKINGTASNMTLGFIALISSFGPRYVVYPQVFVRV